MAEPQNPWQGRNKTPAEKDYTGVFPIYNKPIIFDWAGVDGAILRAFLQVAANAGKTIGIGPALGGRGVTVTLYMGLKQNPKRHALTPAELHELMMACIETWGSPAEDVVELMRAAIQRGPHLDAD